MSDGAVPARQRSSRDSSLWVIEPSSTNPDEFSCLDAEQRSKWPFRIDLIDIPKLVDAAMPGTTSASKPKHISRTNQAGGFETVCRATGRAGTSAGRRGPFMSLHDERARLWLGPAKRLLGQDDPPRARLHAPCGPPPGATREGP